MIPSMKVDSQQRNRNFTFRRPGGTLFSGRRTSLYGPVSYTHLLDGAADPPADRTPITKADLFCLGLSGGKDSQLRRREMLRRLDLPEHMGANALLSVLNALYSREEFLREADAWR